MQYENLQKATELCKQIKDLQSIVDAIQDKGLWVEIKTPGPVHVTQIWSERNAAKDSSYETDGHRVNDFIKDLTKQYKAEIRYMKQKLSEL